MTDATKELSAKARKLSPAERLELVHPVTRKTMGWQVDPPLDMQELIARLRGEQAPAVSRQSSASSSKLQAPGSKR